VTALRRDRRFPGGACPLERRYAARTSDKAKIQVRQAAGTANDDESLSDARARASDLRRSVARGINPVGEKRQGRAEASSRTFQALADRYMVEHARRFKRSASVDERNLRKHVLTEWGRRRFDEIERRDVIALIETLVTAGKPVLANRVQALIRPERAT